MLNSIVEVCSAVIENFLIRCFAGVTFALASFSLGDISQDALVALSFLIVFDSITALLAARKTKTQITSRRFIKTAMKFFVYYMMIVGAHFAEIGLGFNFVLDEIVIGYLAATEFISVLENASKMGYAIPKKLLSTLKDYKNNK